MTKIFRGRIDWIGLGGHAVCLVLWAISIFIWGFWKGRTAEFGSTEWWFDNVAHILLPLAGAINLIYEINYFRPTALFTSPAKRAFILWAVVPLVIICLAILWEGGEAYHDARPFTNIQAQKGDPDTTIDILLSIPSVFGGVWIYTLFSRYRMRKNSKKALGVLTAKYYARRKEWKQERRELVVMKREIISLRRRQTRELPPMALYRQWVPNALSLFRLMLIIPFALAVPTFPLVALFIAILAGLSDFLDGFFARRWESKSKLGAILDPIADKAFYLGGLAVVRQFIPLPFFYFLITGNSAEIFLAGIRFASGYRPEANRFGKVKAFLWYNALCMFLLGVSLENQNFQTAGILFAGVAVPLSWMSLYKHWRSN